MFVLDLFSKIHCLFPKILKNHVFLMHFEEVGNTVYIANKSYALSRLLPSRSPEAKVLI